MLPWFNPTLASAERVTDVRDTSLSKLVKGDVLGLILSGVLVPGQRINEPDVAARLRVSRVPVREALRELESQGLVVARKHAGVFVRQWAPNEIRDLYQLRGLLDGFAGRCAAGLPLPQRTKLLRVLDASVSAMHAAASTQDVQRYYAENLHFHWAIVEAAANRQLSDTYLGIVQKLHLSRLKNLSQDLGIAVSLAEHTDIVQALRNAHAQRCETMLAQHVGDAYQRLLERSALDASALDASTLATA